MQQQRWNFFFSQPHQPFFVLGVFSALSYMLFFMLGFKGVVSLALLPGYFHAYGLIYVTFTAFFQGFLLTTFPRFSQTAVLAQPIYITNFTLMSLGSILFLLGSLFSIWIVYLGMVSLLVAQLYTIVVFYQIYRVSPMSDLHDQFWLIVGFVAGAISHLLFILSLVGASYTLGGLGINIGIYLYLIFVAFTVGQRMIPFFSHVMVEKNRQLLRNIFILLTLYTITHTFALHIDFLFALIAGLYLGYEIYKWKLPYHKAEPILWILHLALFWLPMGLVLGSMGTLAAHLSGQNFQFLQVHLLVLGFLTTVLIGFGTRVTLGHSGNMMYIDPFTKRLFYLTQIVVFARMLYSLTGFAPLFDISITLWLILFVAWSVKYLPVLLFGKRLKGAIQ